MKSSNTHVKVSIRLVQDEDGYPPGNWEDLWALDLGGGKYKIDNVPFYATGISSGDIVTADFQGDRLIFQDVATMKGHSTVRVIMYDEDLIDIVRERLSKIGCSTELSNIRTFFSVDVPSQVNYSLVADLLNNYAEDGALDYEESSVRHS